MPSETTSSLVAASASTSATTTRTADAHTSFALRLADIAGDDITVAVLLACSHGLSDSSFSAAREEVLSFVSSPAVIERFPLLVDVVRASIDRTIGTSPTITSVGQNSYNRQTCTTHINSSPLTVSSLGNTDRRPSVLAIPIPTVTIAPAKSKRSSFVSRQVESGAEHNLEPISSLTKLSLAEVDAEQKSHSQGRRRGGLGPMTALGVLALDSIEDWLGKARLEVLGQPNTSAHRLNSAGFGMEGAGLKTATGGASGKPCPASWIDGVGTGRDYDKCVTYLRLSDTISADVVACFAAASPGIAACLKKKQETGISSRAPEPTYFLDLSKYSHIFELVVEPGTEVVRVETSVSPVDPGDDHSKVKSLKDLVFPVQDLPLTSTSNSSELQVRSGLRTFVGRGSALDVGMFHLEEERCKLTIELTISRWALGIRDNSSGKGVGGSTSESSLPPNAHCLAARCFGGNSCMWLWVLYVDVDGSLVLLMRGDAGKTGRQSGSVLRSLPEAVPISTLDCWTHVAVIIDSSQTPCEPGQGNTAAVTLFVNGEKLLRGSVAVPVVDEESMLDTALYFGVNLSGWKITEIR